MKKFPLYFRIIPVGGMLYENKLLLKEALGMIGRDRTRLIQMKISWED